MSSIDMVTNKIQFIICFLLSFLFIVLYPLLKERSKIVSILSLSVGVTSAIFTLYLYIQYFYFLR